MYATLRAVPVAVILLTVSGCGGDPTGVPTMASVAGTWILQTEDGRPLPIDRGGEVQDSAHVTLAGSGSAGYKTYYTYQNQIEVTSGTGLFTLAGTTITLTWAGSEDVGTGTFSGTTLTMTEPRRSSIWVLKKR